MGSPLRYEIRAVLEADHPRLLALARFLDSVNLPDDAAAVLEVVTQSEAAFSGKVGDPRRRQYVFAVFDRDADRAVGTSMIIGQLGRKDAPYVYFDVLNEEKYSPTLDRHFVHKVLSMGYSFSGPTEIGGLVMHPEYRRAPEKLGMLISYVRFLFIAAHREDFQNELLAELLPPLEEDGKSHLWEAIGRHFTHLTYKEADRLSKRNKEFVRALFPDGDIYASLLPRDARDVIGKVGRETRGVEKLLKRIGFRYANRVDPFDGGPHFVVATDECELVQRASRSVLEVGADAGARRTLLACEYDVPPYFRAVAAPCRVVGEVARVDASTAAHLEIAQGDEVFVLPLD